MTQETLDPCLSRHGGNEQSNAAFRRVNVTKGQQEILNAMRGGGKLTSKELASILNKPLHFVSGRLSELKAKNRIRPTGRPRHGAMELELVPVADDGTPLNEVLADGIGQVMDRVNTNGMGNTNEVQDQELARVPAL